MVGVSGVSPTLHIACPSHQSFAEAKAFCRFNGYFRAAPPTAHHPKLFHHFEQHHSNYGQHRKWRNRGPLCCSSTSDIIPNEEWTVDGILLNMSLALGLQDVSSNAHFSISGRQIWCGLEGDWELKWCMDGRFHERFICSEMELEQGYDGQGNAWAADGAGWINNLELDDEEATLLATWVRTAYWLTEEGRRKLSIGRVTEELLQINTNNGNELYKNAAPDNELLLSIHLKDRKVVSYVSVNPSTWLVSRIQMRAFGGIDRWEFSDWQHSKILMAQPGRFLRLAKTITRYPQSGGVHSYFVSTENVRCHLQEFSPSCPYNRPTSSTLPRHTKYHSRARFDSSCHPSVKMVVGKNGQHLVCPLVNGRNIGYFILDTGASSLVISKQKANELGMDAFGEAFGTGVEGKFNTRFRRGGCFQLGPLSIDFPIFMEAPSDVVVKGVFEDLSGVCGYEIFHHCVVEVCARESRLSLYDPLLYKPSHLQVNWESCVMLGNVPHTSARINGQIALFMLDTGACGADILLHSRAVKEMNLLKRFKWAGSSEVGGLGSGSVAIKVQYGTYPEVEVANQKFFQITALLFSDSQQAIDISAYTAGILGGDLILKQLAIFDYQNHRYALVRV